MKRIFEEVRSDYYDPTEKTWCIDAYWPNSEEGEGTVAARINPDTFEVWYTKDEYKEDPIVVEEVRAKLIDILNGKA